MIAPTSNIECLQSLAERWNKKQIIVIGIDENAKVSAHAFGVNPILFCTAKVLARTAAKAIEESFITEIPAPPQLKEILT